MASESRDPEESVPRKRRMTLLTAVPFWVVTSIAGWAVIAVTVISLGGGDGERIASDENLQEILNFAPAAGVEEPQP